MRFLSAISLVSLACSFSLNSFAHNGVEHEQSNSLDEYLSHHEVVDVCRVNKNPHDANHEKTLTIDSHHKNKITKILDNGGYLGPCAEFGDRQSMGDGYFETYVQLKEDQTPWGIGYVFGENTFNNMPTKKNDGQNCFDVNGNGKLDEDGTVELIDTDLHHDECVAGHQLIMSFPHQDKIKPFKWALLNYQPYGHSPVNVYSKPHFDFHFMTMDFLERNYIRVGPCALLINCDDYQTAVKPLEPRFMHSDFINVGAAEARMGNHLVDETSGEWHGHGYTYTWIYGVYDAKIIFWEPMITMDYLLSSPFACIPLKLPTAYQESGYYPTSYCMRYLPGRKEYRISLEGMVYREKSI